MRRSWVRFSSWAPMWNCKVEKLKPIHGLIRMGMFIFFFTFYVRGGPARAGKVVRGKHDMSRSTTSTNRELCCLFMRELLSVRWTTRWVSLLDKFCVKKIPNSYNEKLQSLCFAGVSKEPLSLSHTQPPFKINRMDSNTDHSADQLIRSVTPGMCVDDQLVPSNTDFFLSFLGIPQKW